MGGLELVFGDHHHLVALLREELGHLLEDVPLGGDLGREDEEDGALGQGPGDRLPQCLRPPGVPGNEGEGAALGRARGDGGALTDNHRESLHRFVTGWQEAGGQGSGPGNASCLVSLSHCGNLRLGLRPAPPDACAVRSRDDQQRRQGGN